MAGSAVIAINTAANPAYALVPSSDGETLAASQAADFNAALNFFYPVNPGAGNVNATLPAAAASGAVGQDIGVVEIKNITTNVGTVTVLPSGGDTVESGASVMLQPGQSARFVSDGVSNWMQT